MSRSHRRWTARRRNSSYSAGRAGSFYQPDKAAVGILKLEAVAHESHDAVDGPCLIGEDMERRVGERNQDSLGEFLARERP